MTQLNLFENSNINEKFKPMMHESWLNKLGPYLSSKEMTNNFKEILEDKKRYKVFPYWQNTFEAFKLTPYDFTNVVILGQDPYYTSYVPVGKLNVVKPFATGLAFGIPEDTFAVPASLKNIVKELQNEHDTLILDFDYTLKSWAYQGVLLLNTALTVVDNKPNSHVKYWENFTKVVFEELRKKENVIYVLWGSNALKYIEFIDKDRNHILTSPHPSPLSAHRGFFGCNHFKLINEILITQQKIPISWWKK
jgi:uracil-DNA glycosylase